MRVIATAIALLEYGPSRHSVTATSREDPFTGLPDDGSIYPTQQYFYMQFEGECE